MIWKTVKQWEEENKREYPHWAAIWHYDAYGEAWEPALWRSLNEFYEKERKEPKNENAPMWKVYFEPMVCDPTLPAPKWGDGIPLAHQSQVVGT